MNANRLGCSHLDVTIDGTKNIYFLLEFTALQIKEVAIP